MSIVKIIRHSIKADDGSLSEAGIDAAIQYGRDLASEYAGYRIIANSSDVARAKDTAELIMEGANTEYNSEDTIDQRLSLGYTAEEIEAIKSSDEDTLYKKAEAEVPETTQQRGYEISDYVTEHVDDGDDSTVYVGVTHSPNVESYCYQISNDDRAKESPEPLEGVSVEGGEANIEYAGVRVEIEDSQGDNYQSDSSEVQDSYNESAEAGESCE